MRKTTSGMLALVAGVLLATVGDWALAVPVYIDALRSNDLTQVGLEWEADTDTFYEIYTTTNLVTTPWTPALEHPVSPTNLSAHLQLLITDNTRFFQVRRLDTQGPTIVERYPGPEVANVGLEAPLTVVVSDPSGIDTNAFRLDIVGEPVLLPGSPGVSVTTNSFTYDPAAAGTTWGAHGTNVTVSFVCADLKGNPTLAEWSFHLEVPVVLAEDIVVLGPPPPQPDVQEFQIATSESTGLEIVSIHPDRVVLSYSGASHGITIGMLLVNGDVANLFYRRVTGLVDDPDNQRVTAYTDDVPFSEVITEGSFDSGDFVWVDADGMSPQGITPQAEFERSIRFSSGNTYTVSRNWGAITVTGNAGYDLSGGLSFSTEAKWGKVTRVESDMNADLRVMLDAQLSFDATASPQTRSIGLLGDGILLGQATGWIYAIPVKVSLWLDMDLCMDAHVSDSITLAAEASARVTYINNISYNYNRDTKWVRTGGATFTYDLPPVQLGGVMEGYAHVYIRPALSVRLYEAIGLKLDYRRGPMVSGAYVPATGTYRFGLYDKRSVNVGVWLFELPSFLEGFIDTDDLPSWPLWSAETLARPYWYSGTPPASPVFTLHPQSRAATSGQWVTLSASASGSPTPTYQWYKDGRLQRDKTSSTFGFTMGTSAVGDYHVVARNSHGTVSSQTASVTLQASVPSGMALIPGGTNSGNAPDFGAYSLTVSPFYMDRYPVTKALWDEVYTWAIANGYSFDNRGAGKAANHPVHTVNWYDVVKWCNARSQKEGRPAVYAVNGAVYKTGRHNNVVQTSVAGYRLPADTEWEYAARGGVSGRRFPWGDSIQHARANYYSDSLDSYYDTSPTQGYHPTYNMGDYPYTSPVGSFAANGYGLYDMAGNLFEWCFDWHPLYVGSTRVVRGGSWRSLAAFSRVGYRDSLWPAGAYADFGFRTVLPLQPPASDGMVLIPGGTNSGTNPLADGESHNPDWYPETYSLTVDTFYMAKHPVTKGCGMMCTTGRSPTAIWPSRSRTTRSRSQISGSSSTLLSEVITGTARAWLTARTSSSGSVLASNTAMIPSPVSCSVSASSPSA